MATKEPFHICNDRGCIWSQSRQVTRAKVIGCFDGFDDLALPSAHAPRIADRRVGMAAKTCSQTTTNAGVDELLFQNDTVSLCLLVNRRNRTLRVIDFRAGPTVAKRNFVLATAKREGVEKVFTLVERDEVSTWTRLGFAREGSIPGFYKRSDAWILGAVVAQVGPIQPERMTFGYDDDELDDVPIYDDGSASPAAAQADKTIQKAKKRIADLPGKALPAIKIATVRDADARKAVATAERARRALTGFEPFSRDATRKHFVLTGRGGFEMHASTEMQQCFGNSFLEILVGPTNDAERVATVAALRVLGDKLKEEGCVSTFTFAPADDLGLATVFLAGGYRRSAVLARHLVVGGERKDAILWSKKLAVPEA